MVHYREATQDDAAELFSLVNAAYAIEKGNTGLAFKNCDRYLTIEEVIADISAQNTIYLVAQKEEEGIVGCACIHLPTKGEKKAGLGPIAVKPNAQKQNVGTSMLQEVDQMCAAKRVQNLDIEVVNWRVDLLGWYESRGFHRIGIAPCDAAHNCDEEKLTREAHFVLMTKTYPTT
eukprot:m.14733 g.14733  ORF g.14733 m.14733 type:complete len:175 (-) comp5193_c0_seq1:1515-2039(-)